MILYKKLDTMMTLIIVVHCTQGQWVIKQTYKKFENSFLGFS